MNTILTNLLTHTEHWNTKWLEKLRIDQNMTHTASNKTFSPGLLVTRISGTTSVTREPGV